jgi:hypothetical protein
MAPCLIFVERDITGVRFLYGFTEARPYDEGSALGCDALHTQKTALLSGQKTNTNT